jgi:hypothetical protein
MDSAPPAAPVPIKLASDSSCRTRVFRNAPHRTTNGRTQGCNLVRRGCPPLTAAAPTQTQGLVKAIQKLRIDDIKGRRKHSRNRRAGAVMTGGGRVAHEPAGGISPSATPAKSAAGTRQTAADFPRTENARCRPSPETARREFSPPSPRTFLPCRNSRIPRSA